MSKKDDDKQNSEQPEAEDLALIDPGLEDEAKSDEEIWDEIDAEESGDEPAGDDPAGDELEEAAAAAAADDAETEAKTTDNATGDETPETDASAAGDEEPADIWEGASDEQKAAFEAVQKQVETLEQKDRSSRGRVSTLQRQVNDLTRQFDQTAADKAADGGAGEDANAAEALFKSKQWLDFADEFPEVSGPLASLFETQQKEIDAVKAEQGKQRETEVQDHLDEQVKLLGEEHPDWEDVADSDEFGPWLDDQPRHIQEAAIRNAEGIVDAREAADVIGRFKASRSEGEPSPGPDDTDKGGQEDTSLAERRKRQLESSQGARPRGRGTVKSGIPEDGDEEEIWAAFDKEDERKAAAGG